MGTLGSSASCPAGRARTSFPPQPMVTQIRDVLERYAAAAGACEIEMFEGSGHFPPIDARERWSAQFFGFLESVSEPRCPGWC